VLGRKGRIVLSSSGFVLLLRGLLKSRKNRGISLPKSKDINPTLVQLPLIKGLT